MKKKSFRYGKNTYTNIIKKAGVGYEVVLKSGSKILFTGNFIHSKEANQWYSKLNKELKTFFSKYWATEDTSVTFYQKMITNFVYNDYYQFLNRHVIAKNHKSYTKEFNKHLRKYKSLKRDWYPSEKLKVKNVA